MATKGRTKESGGGDPMRRVIAEMLLEEVKDGVLSWYYISAFSEGNEPTAASFVGGYFIKARGETEAMCLLHMLGLYPSGCGTVCSKVDDEAMAHVPDDYKWRKLNRREVESL